ncbi:MAG: NADAR family protein [Natronospirillum sp.]
MLEHPPEDTQTVAVHRQDPDDFLGSSIARPFTLDGQNWKTAEHYYQAMKYPDRPRFHNIVNAPNAVAARKLGKGWLKRTRADWKQVRLVMMTRAIYTQCRTHPNFAQALVGTGDQSIQELSQYDYYWGRGRDQRGLNHYGKVLMDVRRKLQAEAPPEEATER